MNWNRIVRSTSLGAAALAVAGAAVAHHSFAMFDRTRTVTIEGTVRTFEWTNPHIWLWLNVPDGKGGTIVWGFEGVAPGEAARLNGWTKSTFVKGEKLTVEASPLKDGRPGGSYRKITRADGTVVTRDGGGPNAPGPGTAGPGGAPGYSAPGSAPATPRTE
jgi:hypothetical protein